MNVPLIRMLLAVVMICATLYAAIGLIGSVIDSSLTHFLAGMGIWGAAAFAYWAVGRVR